MNPRSRPGLLHALTGSPPQPLQAVPALVGAAPEMDPTFFLFWLTNVSYMPSDSCRLEESTPPLAACLTCSLARYRQRGRERTLCLRSWPTMESLRALCPGLWTTFSLSLCFPFGFGPFSHSFRVLYSCATLVIRYWLSLTPFHCCWSNNHVALVSLHSALYSTESLLTSDFITLRCPFFFLLSSPVSSPTFPSLVIDVLQDEGFFFRVLLSPGLCSGHWIGMPIDNCPTISTLTSTVLGF
jgi:hypothetical protein